MSVKSPCFFKCSIMINDIFADVGSLWKRANYVVKKVQEAIHHVVD